MQLEPLSRAEKSLKADDNRACLPVSLLAWVANLCPQEMESGHPDTLLKMQDPLRLGGFPLAHLGGKSGLELSE